MSGTNPGTWPDQEPKVVKCCRCGHPFVMAADFCGNILCEECDSQMSSKTVDLKAARLETVERCIAAVKHEERADVEYLAQPANVVYNTAIEHCMRALHELKEEINAS